MKYGGKDKRISAIVDALNKMDKKWNVIKDHFRFRNNQTGNSAVVHYETDKYPSPFEVCFSNQLEEWACDIYDPNHGFNEHIFIDASSYNNMINKLTSDGSYYISGIKFESYVEKYSNYNHFPPYTKLPGIYYSIAGLKPGMLYTINVGKVYLDADTEHEHYRGNDVKTVDTEHNLLGFLFDSEGNQYFNDLSPYNKTNLEYDNKLTFNESVIPGHDYIFSYNYGTLKDSWSYGQYAHNGVYHALELDSNSQYSAETKPFSVKVQADEWGRICFFLVLSAVLQPCRNISIWNIKVDESETNLYIRNETLDAMDPNSTRDNILSTYKIKNPGAEILSGTTTPDAYVGKDGDLYVVCGESFDASMYINENQAADACHIWSVTSCSKFNNKYYIYAESNQNPSPEDIVYEVWDESTQTYYEHIEEPYVSVVLSSLNTNLVYHFSIKCDNYVHAVWNQLVDKYEHLYDVFYIDNFRILHTMDVLYENGREYIILDFYYRPRSSSVVFRIPTTDIHLLTPETYYTDPITASWIITVKTVVPDAMWYKADSRWYQFSGGGGGGSSVTITPTYSEGVKIADYSINGNPGELRSPYTEIVPNPVTPTPPTNELDTIKIGSQVFALGGGSEVSFESFLSTGVIIGELTINGQRQYIYAPEGGGGGGSEEATMITAFTDVERILNPSGDFIDTKMEFLSFTNPSSPGNKLIPYMTSNTAPSGTASSSTQNSDNHMAYNAFDGRVSYWLPTTSDTAPYLEYSWDTEFVTFTKLAIGTYNDGITAVSRTITIEGLKDDDTWENCLQDGLTASLYFPIKVQQTQFINLNGNSYKAIRMTGNTYWFISGQYACLIESFEVY